MQRCSCHGRFWLCYTGVSAPAGLYSAFGHAHELLIGYAMLVVAGYLLGPLQGRKILLLIGVWLLARIGFLSLPGGFMAVAGAAIGCWLDSLLDSATLCPFSQKMAQ